MTIQVLRLEKRFLSDKAHGAGEGEGEKRSTVREHQGREGGGYGATYVNSKESLVISFDTVLTGLNMGLPHIYIEASNSGKNIEECC